MYRNPVPKTSFKNTPWKPPRSVPHIPSPASHTTICPVSSSSRKRPREEVEEHSPTPESTWDEYDAIPPSSTDAYDGEVASLGLSTLPANYPGSNNHIYNTAIHEHDERRSRIVKLPRLTPTKRIRNHSRSTSAFEVGAEQGTRGDAAASIDIDPQIRLNDVSGDSGQRSPPEYSRLSEYASMAPSKIAGGQSASVNTSNMDTCNICGVRPHLRSQMECQSCKNDYKRFVEHSHAYMTATGQTVDWLLLHSPADWDRKHAIMNLVRKHAAGPVRDDHGHRLAHYDNIQKLYGRVHHFFATPDERGRELAAWMQRTASRESVGREEWLTTTQWMMEHAKSGRRGISLVQRA